MFPSKTITIKEIRNARSDMRSTIFKCRDICYRFEDDYGDKIKSLDMSEAEKKMMNNYLENQIKNKAEETLLIIPDIDDYQLDISGVSDNIDLNRYVLNYRRSYRDLVEIFNEGTNARMIRIGH